MTEPFRGARAALAIVLGLCAPMAARAHEFWIEPQAYALAPGDALRASLKVGEMFAGASYPYVPDNFLRFEAGPADRLRPVPGRMGDRPALALEPHATGLWVIVHETTALWLTYDGWERFEAFTGQHDLGAARDLHRARGLPDNGFREMYFRHAKSLVAVGDGRSGADRRLGLEVEIVAETNPYTVRDGGPVVLRMFDGGAPRADAQMELFVRHGGKVTRDTLRSDAQGRVTAVLPAGAEVLANFTTLEPVEGDPAAREAVWLSRWASLTFAMP